MGGGTMSVLLLLLLVVCVKERIDREDDGSKHTHTHMPGGICVLDNNNNCK